jgi:hypothetical protein
MPPKLSKLSILIIVPLAMVVLYFASVPPVCRFSRVIQASTIFPMPSDPPWLKGYMAPYLWVYANSPFVRKPMDLYAEFWFKFPFRR